MSGYFARAIQQTGISITAASNRSWEMSAPSVTSAEENNAVQPLEEEVVINGTVEAIADGGRNSGGESEPEQTPGEILPVANRTPSPRVETASDTDNTQKWDDRAQPFQPSDRSIPTPESAGDESVANLSSQEEVIFTPEVIAREVSTPTPSQSIEVNYITSESSDIPVVSQKKTKVFLTPNPTPQSALNNETQTSQNLPPPTTPPSTPVSTRELETENTVVASSSASIPQTDNTSEIQQVYLQDVWDWVGGTSREMETKVEGKTQRKEGREIGKTSPLPHQTPEVQEFSLSIGTISLTIEAPTPELPKPVTTTRRQAEPAVKSDTQGSRLRRHYLRLQ